MTLEMNGEAGCIRTLVWLLEDQVMSRSASWCVVLLLNAAKCLQLWIIIGLAVLPSPQRAGLAPASPPRTSIEWGTCWGRGDVQDGSGQVWCGALRCVARGLETGDWRLEA